MNEITATPEQEAIIRAPLQGRRCVDAGAGTGKTTTLALRALHLIQSGQLQAHELLVVTFTRKAAAEITERITQTLQRAGVMPQRGITCSTIHALAYAILREFSYDAGHTEIPRGIGNAEARAIFHRAYRALLDGDIAVDTSAFPLFELKADVLEEELGDLALRLKAMGITADEFERQALEAADVLAAQSWGQLWTQGKTKATDLKPKVPLSPEQRQAEAERERKNVQLVAAVLRRFDEELRKNSAATYGDQILLATKLLNDRPEIAKHLRSRWKYAMVDEFQDTSAVQMAFLRAIFGDAPMMPVGDYRQSIYAFNGADPRVMDEYKAIADEVYYLTENRRSHQEIVDAAHALLLSSNPSIVDADTPRLQASKGDGGLECVRVQHFQSDEDGAGVAEHVEVEAAAIADEIASLVAGGAALSDIAILLRMRTHAQAYVKALNARNIPVALDQRTGLLDAPEIRDAMAWLSLLDNLSDTHAAARILQSRTIGLSDASMVTLAAEKNWLREILNGSHVMLSLSKHEVEQRLARFRTYIEQLLDITTLSLPQAIRKLLTTCPIAASYAIGRNTASAQALANLRNFELLAQHFAAENPAARLSEFLRELETRVTYEDDTPEAELDFEGVQILTVHRAKGLEWPYVFAACASPYQYGVRGSGEWAVRYDDEHRALAFKCDIDGRPTLRWLMSGTDYDPQTGRRRTAKTRTEAAKAEQTRVLYVAMTRAKQRLYLSVPGASAPHLDPVKSWAAENGAAHTDLHFRIAESAAAPAPEMSATRTPKILELVSAGDDGYRQPSLFEPRLSFTAIATYQQCPRQAYYRYRLRLPDVRDSDARYAGAGDYDPAKIDAATFGSLVHRALELWGQAIIDGAAPLSADDALAQALHEFADVNDAAQSRAGTYIANAIAALDGYTPLAVEQPFEVMIGGERVEGVIDLIARAADGSIAIIDYKTGKTEDEHYGLQLRLYSEYAAERYPDSAIFSKLLRIDEQDAAFTGEATTDGIAELIQGIHRLGDLEPRPGPWCQSCAYANAPCEAAPQAKYGPVVAPAAATM